MTIQINTDKIVSGDQRAQEYFTAQIEKSLKRYQSHITRIEVHLSDANGNREGLNDKSCLLEARLEHREPIVVTNQTDTLKGALTGAIDKLESVLQTILGKIQNH